MLQGRSKSVKRVSQGCQNRYNGSRRWSKKERSGDEDYDGNVGGDANGNDDDIHGCEKESYIAHVMLP